MMCTRTTIKNRDLIKASELHNFMQQLKVRKNAQSEVKEKIFSVHNAL